jgi:hypothetical protein
MEHTREQEQIYRLIRKKDSIAKSSDTPENDPQDEDEHGSSRNEAGGRDGALINTRAELESVRKRYQEELAYRISLESQCSMLARQRDEDAQTLSVQATELENLKMALLTQDAEELKAEQEIRSLLEEKSRSEEDLRQKLSGISETAELHAEENLRLARDLAAEQSQRTRAEDELGVFRQEWEKRVSGIVAEMGSVKETRDILQQQFDALSGALGAEREKTAALESEILGLKASLGQHEADMRTIQLRLDEAVSSAELEKNQYLDAEKKWTETIETQDKELEDLSAENTRIRGELDTLAARLAGTHREQEAAENTRKDPTTGPGGAGYDGNQGAPANSPDRDLPRGKSTGREKPPVYPGRPVLTPPDLSESDLTLERHRQEELVFRKRKDKAGLHKSLGRQALIYRDRGELEKAMKLLREEELICREIGDKDGLQRSLGNQAVIHREWGEPDYAMKLHKEKERISRELGNTKGIVLSLLNQAGILVYDRRDPAAALPLLEEAYKLAVSSGSDSLISQVRSHLEKARSMNHGRRR